MCGNRLNAWKTIPMLASHAVHVDAPHGDVLAAEGDSARVDRLEQVHAAQEGRLPRSGRPDQADDVVLGEREVDPTQHLELAERLVHVLDAERLARHASLPPCCRRRSRAMSQSVKRASGIVIATKSVPATR